MTGNSIFGYFYMALILGEILFLKKTKRTEIGYFFQLILCLGYMLKIDISGYLICKLLINCLIGILLTPMLLSISCMTRGDDLWGFAYSFDLSGILIVIREEIIWRSIALSLVDITCDTSIVYWGWCVFCSAIFVLYHDDVCLKDFLEMFFFSCVLSIGYLLAPGVNIGLHWERNCIIYNMRKNNEKDTGKVSSQGEYSR